MSAPVVHLEARGLDPAELRDFYQRIFGWERDESLSIDDYSVADLGEGRLTIGIGPVPDWSAREAKFFIQVDDIDETLGRIEAAGGRRIMPRTVGPDFGATHILIFTTFLDPAGNTISLVEKPRG